MRDSVPTQWGCSNCCRGRQLATVSRLTCRTSCAASSTRLRADAEGLNGRGEMRKKRLHKPFTRCHCCLYSTRGSRRVSPDAFFPFLGHDPGQPEALAAMDAAPRGGVRSQSAASRASLAESRARLPRRGENAGAPQLLVARGHDAKGPHRLFVTPQAWNLCGAC